MNTIITIYMYPIPSIDLNYLEDSAGGPDLPLALLPQTETITMLQMDSKLPVDMFENVLRMAVEGCKAIHQILLKEVENYTQGVIEARQAINT